MLYLAIFLTLEIIIILVLITIIIIDHTNIKSINKQLDLIINSDTNSKIMISTRMKYLAKFTNDLNAKLTKLKTLERGYKEGNQRLKKNIINLAHDLRTPITAILGYLSLLEDKGIKSDELDIINNRIEELKLLTEDLFRYALIAEMEINKEKINIIPLLKEVTLSFYASLTQKHIEVDVAIMTEEIEIVANKEIINRIFNNIYSNILKYAEKDLKVEATAKKIIFSNHTSKMDHLKLERIFDRFYTVSYQNSSTGLGLDIARELMEKLGYKIGAKYENGLFSIILDFTHK